MEASAMCSDALPSDLELDAKQFWRRQLLLWCNEVVVPPTTVPLYTFRHAQSDRESLQPGVGVEAVLWPACA